MKIFRKIFLFLCFIFLLNLSTYIDKDEKLAYNNFRHPYVQQLFVPENVNQGVDTLNLNNSLASLYFSNLRQNIPFNIFDSCGYVALSMYLSFLDSTYNDNIIPEHLESKSSVVDITSQNLGTIYKWYSLEHESPGVVPENASIINNMNLSTYLNASSSLKSTYFHSLLVDIFKSNSLFSYSNNSLGLSPNALKVLISTYFNQYLGFSSGNYTVTNANNYPSLNQYVRSKIYQGIPVLVFLENNNINHVGIAYDYDIYSLDIFVHTGWKNEFGETINKLRIPFHHYKDIDFEIVDALTIELNQTNHNHIYNYVDENSTGFCICEYLVPSFVSVTNHYVDTTPRIARNSFFVHPTFENLNCHFNIEISASTPNLIVVNNYTDNEYYIDYDVWLSLFTEFETEIFNIFIEFECDIVSLKRSINLIYDLNYDSDKASLIVPGDYYNGTDFPTTDFPTFAPYDNYYLNFDIYSEGVQNGNNSIILNPSLSNNISSIHYYFDRDISRFDLNIGFSGNEIPISLYNNSILEVQILENESWITYFDLFQTNLFDLNINGNTTFIPIYFYVPVNQIRIVYQISDEIGYNYSHNFVIKTCVAYSGTVHTNPDGNELKYEPNLWNLDPINPTNCYSYALNDPNLGFAQVFDEAYPGVSILDLYYLNYTYTAINNMLMNDIRARGKGVSILETVDSCCVNNGYRIAFAVTEEFDDFHFYRQNKDGTWSHKIGARAVTNRDSNGNIIYKPSESYVRNGVGDEYNIIGYFEIF